MRKTLTIAAALVVIVAAIILGVNMAKAQTVPSYVSAELTVGMHQIFPDSTGIMGLSYMQCTEASSDLRIILHTRRATFGDTVQIAPTYVTADTDTAMSVTVGTQFSYVAPISIIEVLAGTGVFWGER